MLMSLSAARKHRTAPALLVVLSLLLVGLASVGGPQAQAAASFTARGSAKQVYAVGLPARAWVSLVDKHGDRVERRRADEQGGVLFRHVRPGTGYHVRSGGQSSDALTVHGNNPRPWDESSYDQSLPIDGYGYLTTRDGTRLAYT